MSDETPDEAVSNSGWPLEPPEADSILGLFLDLAERAGFEIGLTLAIPGGLVTGTLVSGSRWLEAVAATIGRDVAGGKALAEGLETLAKGYREPPRDVDDPGPWYVHLLEAQHVSGGQFVPSPATTPWRIRLDQVAGWTLGAMSRSRV